MEALAVGGRAGDLGGVPHEVLGELRLELVADLPVDPRADELLGAVLGVAVLGVGDLVRAVAVDGIDLADVPDLVLRELSNHHVANLRNSPRTCSVSFLPLNIDVHARFALCRPTLNRAMVDPLSPFRL